MAGMLISFHNKSFDVIQFFFKLRGGGGNPGKPAPAGLKFNLFRRRLRFAKSQIA